MFITLRLAIAGLLLSVMVCGCQSPSSKWAMSSKAAAPQSKGAGKSDDRESWPPKSAKGSESLAKSSSAKSDALSKTTEHVKDAAQLSELLEKGDRFRKSGQYEEARIAYAGALAISPNSPDVNHRLAIIADKQQQFSLADQFYQTALRSRPKDVNLLSDLGYSYSLRGNSKQAERTLKQALAIEPTHRGAMANLGSIYAQQNRYDDALAMFRKGSTTESEARQYMAKLFPDATASDVAESENPSTGESSLAASKSSAKGVEVNDLTVEQLRSELARRQQTAKSSPGQAKSWDDSDAEAEKLDQFQAQLQRTVQRDSEKNSSEGIARGEVPRSLADPQILQARGEAHEERTGADRPAGNSAQTSRLATKIGMNCGPGNLFPILSGAGNGSEPADAHGSQGKTSQVESPPQKGMWSAQAGYVPSDTKKADLISKTTFIQNQSEPSGPANGVKSAAVASRSAAWRDHLQDSVSWDADTRDFEESQSDSAPTNGQGPGANKSSILSPIDRLRGESESVAGTRRSNDSARPFTGSWPKPNDLPGRQKGSNSANDASREGFDRISVNLGGTAEGNSKMANGPVSSLSTRSSSRWPDTPDR